MGCSNYNYWILDKWDKIGIASLFIFFAIFVVLNTFCFAVDAENVSYTILNNVSFGSSGEFVEGGTTAYFSLEPRL